MLKFLQNICIKRAYFDFNLNNEYIAYIKCNYYNCKTITIIILNKRTNIISLILFYFKIT